MKTFKRTWSAGGATLVELMTAMVVPTIAVLGTSIRWTVRVIAGNTIWLQGKGADK